MLPGDAATGGDAGPQDLLAGGDDFVQLSGDPDIKEDVGMQVAVAGVKHIGDAQMVSGADVGDLPHDLGQPAARDHPVLHVVVGCQRTQRAEGALAALPQPQSLSVVLGHAHSARPASHADLLDHTGAALRGFAHSFQLDQQHGVGIAWISDRRPGFHRLDGETVHHLQGGRDDPGSGDVHDRLRGGIHAVEDGQQRAYGFAAPHQPQHGFGHNAYRPLGADERAAQIVAGRIRRAPAQPDHATVIKDHLDAQHMIGRDAVGQRVRTAGVVRDIPAD